MGVSSWCVSSLVEYIVTIRKLDHDVHIRLRPHQRKTANAEYDQ